ncbi:metal-binding protein [Ectobacillus antri]|jgi:uncharacterized metal-binding protein|uniref:Metal-binding protein n=1 Tax=Ectobacillus antri TaxID=2486280 RepID=A0ABT6H792_9BACI|nr:metal-binding protein [Ectobacillus antri]MDG4657194.1 metal-binding protein [Ectobacillus antri]MDG5755207.1 metal-binding protein [Ectobacillus antri]
MPSGKTHTSLNLFALPFLLFLLISYGFTSWGFLLWFCGGFIAGTYFLSPDLDTRSTPYRAWGPLRVLWYPYQVIMPHRSPLTHMPIIGDVLRVLYFVCVSIPIVHVLDTYVYDVNVKEILMRYKSELVIIFFGIVTASTLHIMVDIMNTKRKRLWKKRRK